MLKYFWIRIFDYNYLEIQSEGVVYPEFQNIWDYDKGVLLEELYVAEEDADREYCKKLIKEKYKIDKFAKPRNGKSGKYAIIMDSTEFYYNRFTKELPENCICFKCHKPISGKAKDFPEFFVDKNHLCSDELYSKLKDEKLYCCSYECVRALNTELKQLDTLEWQTKDGYEVSGIFGYIYHIYNRANNKHYIGQTRYMPFFRWQEHAKDNVKGDITDLTFEVIAVIKDGDANYLNNVEAYWIQYFTEMYGSDNVMNITHPTITIDSLYTMYQNAFDKYNFIQRKLLNS